VNARFHAPGACADTVVALPADEARHLVRVLRLRPGDAVAVFDGRGGEFEALVEQIAGDRVDVRVGAARVPAAEPGVTLTLAQAVLKGDKMDDVVRDATMMGVAAVQPVLATRSEISRSTLDRAHRRERWERIAIASVKQCGRAVVPHVRDPLDVAAVPEAIASRRLPAPAFLLVEPSAAADTMALREIDPTPPREATILIGPEGGWTSAELSALAGPCRPITVGARTLRADAMATVAIAALLTKWGDF
jgi:16S rRNA (uracil1498-N3)-methyltransferase